MVSQVQIGTDQVIVGQNRTALVSTKSQPGSWHTVRAGRCDCIGFAKRGRCRHVNAVAAAAGQPTAVNPTFALSARTLGGEFSGHRQREEWDFETIAAGDTVSFTEWRERLAS